MLDTSNVSPEPQGNQEQAQPEGQETQETQVQVPVNEVALGDPNTDAVIEGQEETNPETLYADKFKSVSDLEKSYLELQSTFSKKMGDFKGAPEEGYVYDQEIDLSPEENLMIQELQTWGTENQLSQEGFEGLVNNYTQWQDQIKEQRLQEEYQKLGQNADQRLKNVTDYLVQNVGKELTDKLAENMMSADAIEAIEQLISLNKSASTMTQSQAPTQNYSKEKIEAMRFATNSQGERLMSVDPAYRDKVLKLEAQMLKG